MTAASKYRRRLKYTFFFIAFLQDIYSTKITLFNLVIGLNGFNVSSGLIDSKLNGSSIIAKPLDVNKSMRIGTIKKKNAVLSRYGSFYMEALKNHLSIV